MQVDELRQMDDDNLLEEYEDQKASLYRLRQLHTTGELVDTSQFKKTKKTIARILTVLRERELAEQIALMEEDV
jgi:large subunit ribosomal protein L29